MKLKELQSLLQDVDAFENPKVDLEQYTTGIELGATMLHTIDSAYQDLQGRTVLDLGCGTGRLAIGAALLGSTHVIGVDVDQDALEVCSRNIEQFQDLPVDLLQCNVLDLGRLYLRGMDTVVMNPPFGTRKKGADIDFLRIGLQIARNAVYSLHKSSTRGYIQRLVEKEYPATGKVLAHLRYDLPSTYAFHKVKSKDIEVDLWRFEIHSERS